MKSPLKMLMSCLVVLAVLLGPAYLAAAEERAEKGNGAAQEEKKEDPGKFKVYWKDGIRLDSADGKFKIKIGGRIMNDWLFASGDDPLEAAVGELEGGTEFRRARLYVSGTIYGNLEFKAQYDWAGGTASFKDLYIGLKKVPGLGTFRVGHFKEPFGLEELTSSKYITFMERSTITAFIPSRNNGFAVMNHTGDERVTWAAGVFRDTDSQGKMTGDEFNFTARLTALPWLDGGNLFHVGAAFSIRSPNGDVVRYRERPEVHLTHRFVDTGSFSADSASLLGVETAAVSGPFSVQGEYVTARVGSDSAGDPTFSGYYLSGSYFITGEQRRYKKSSGAFDRVKPHRNFSPGGGSGALEVAVRYSHLDLEESSIAGRVLDDVTLGLNWYFNPNARFMFNYTHADVDSVGAADFFQMRFQVDF